MEKVQEVAQFANLMYAFFAALVTFVLWLGKLEWNQKQNKQDSEKRDKEAASNKVALDERMRTFERDMNDRIKNEAVYKTLLNQIISGQNEMKEDFRSSMKEFRDSVSELRKGG